MAIGKWAAVVGLLVSLVLWGGQRVTWGQVNGVMGQRFATSGLQPILVLDGTDDFPCDGVYHWSRGLAIDGAVVKTYLFVSMNPNAINGLNAVIWSPLYGGWGSLGTVNLLQTTPSHALAGQNERSFLPESVIVSTVYVGVVCWGGGNAQAYAEVFVRVP